MVRNRSKLAALVLSTGVGLGSLACLTSVLMAQRPSRFPSGKITFIRLRSPHPDVVEELDLASGAIERLIQGSADRPGIRSFTYSSDGSRFLTEMGSGKNWYANNEIYLGERTDGRLQQLTENNVYDGRPVWSPDDKHLAFVRGWGLNGRVYVLDLESRDEETVRMVGIKWARSPLWMRKGRRLLMTASDDNGTKGITEFDLSRGTARWLLKGDVDYVRISPDNERLACVVQGTRPTGDFAIPEWIYRVHVLAVDTANLEAVGPEPGLSERDISPVWSPAGDRLAWIRNDLGGQSCQLLIWELSTNNLRALPLSDEEGADGGSLVWSPDGNRLACVTRDRKRTRYNLCVIETHSGASTEVMTGEHQIQCCHWQ